MSAEHSPTIDALVLRKNAPSSKYPAASFVSFSKNPMDAMRVVAEGLEHLNDVIIAIHTDYGSERIRAILAD
jgi:hypothetical protein